MEVNDTEQLSKLTTLKEVREKWLSHKGIVIGSTTIATFGGLFSLAKTPALVPVSIKKRRTRLTLSKKTPVRRTTIKKKTRRGFVYGNRRSIRLAFNTDSKQEEEISTDNEVMEVSDSLDVMIYCKNFF